MPQLFLGIWRKQQCAGAFKGSLIFPEARLINVGPVLIWFWLPKRWNSID